MRGKRTIAGLVSAAVVACGVLSGCGSSGSSGPGGSGPSGGNGPVHLALVSFDLPGLNYLGLFEQGANAAAKEINATGGFGGRRLVIDTCNSMLQPADATTCAYQTIAQHPVAMFGCDTAWASTGLSIYSRAQIPSFNCPNSTADFTNPWNFPISAGAFGEQRAMATFVCTMPTVKKVLLFTQDSPQQRHDAPLAVGSVFARCGKTVSYYYANETTVDITPDVTRALQTKPDFIIDTSGVSNAVLLFKALQQAGYPASHVSIVGGSLDLLNVLRPAGSAMNGVYATNEFGSWGDTANPDVAAYLRAMRGYSDPYQEADEWGYSAVMLFYTAAKRLGFANFTAASLTRFMRTTTGFPLPLSRSVINPGPKGYASVKQPYVQLVQWKNGKLTVIQKGTDHGWVLGF